LKSTLYKDNRGFVFSLDASLALLVVLIIVGGAARIEYGELAYEQQGYLRLERYANDALETMILTKTLDNVVELITKNDNAAARALARTELRKALPEEVQFKLVIGDCFEVYPTDNYSWDAIFATTSELATATRVTPKFTKATTAWILAWLDGPDQLEDNFMDELETFAKNTGADWHVTRVYTESEFWNKLRPYSTYDVVFMPDIDLDFHNNKTWWLIEYAYLGGRYHQGGKLVVGGQTLFNNWSGVWDLYLWWLLGVVLEFGGPQQLVGSSYYDNMKIIDDTRYVTLPYENGDCIRYAGTTYAQYRYVPRDGILDPFDKVHVIAQWESSPPGGPTPPWPGIIVRDSGWTLPNGWTMPASSVLFNMRLAQNAMDQSVAPTLRDTNNWVQLAARAIGYLGTSELKPVTLYVWRGQEAS
jgi:hypothetical protein